MQADIQVVDGLFGDNPQRQVVGADLTLIKELRRLRRHKRELATSALKVMDRHTDYLGCERFRNPLLRILQLACI